jgi:hypothetical protein
LALTGKQRNREPVGVTQSPRKENKLNREMCGQDPASMNKPLYSDPAKSRERIKQVTQNDFFFIATPTKNTIDPRRSPLSLTHLIGTRKTSL